MASRMERLHEKEERSTKNEHIYRKLDEYQINEMGSYTNIEGVAKLDGNEVNIEMVKKLINSSSNNNNKKDKPVKKDVKEEIEEEQNHDINDILDKAKEELPVDDHKYRSLKNYELLKQIKVNSEEEKEELKEIINTMALENLPDDLGIFDDLKSDTMVGNSESIKKIIEEAKEEEKLPDEEEEEPIIDRSFYTASFNLSDKELSDFKNIGLDIKKNNKLIKILILISSIILAVIILVLVAKTIF